MAKHFPPNGPAIALTTPLTLTTLQTCVGGFIKFVELPHGDLMVVNEASTDLAPFNPSASSLAGKAGPIYGDAVLCEPSEIA